MKTRTKQKQREVSLSSDQEHAEENVYSQLSSSSVQV